MNKVIIMEDNIILEFQEILKKAISRKANKSKMFGQVELAFCPK